MDYELKDIKEIRKQSGITQAQLAKKAKVSQSLIAKIEAGRLDPTYNNAKKIFSALEDINKKDDIKALDVLTKKVIHISAQSGIQEIIKKMKKYEISQMPVIDDEKVVGYLSETIVLDCLMKGKNNLKAKDIMKEAPPIIDKFASLNVLSGLLKYYPMVLVKEHGKTLGIITKSDIIRKLSSRSRFSLFSK